MLTLTPATAALYSPIRIQPNDRMAISITDNLERFEIDIFSTNGKGSISPPSYSASNEFGKRIPEKFQCSRTNGWAVCYSFGATDCTASLIQALWPASQLIWDEDAHTVYEYLCSRLKEQDLSALTSATYKESHEVQPHNLSLHPDLPLSKYQQVAALNSLRSEGYGLFMEQGTGKTPVVISRICTDALSTWEKEQRPYRTIIVCPNNVRLNWEKEFHKFATVAGNVTVLRGGHLKRIKAIIEAFQFSIETRFTALVVSYESLSKTWEQLGMIEWDLAVADEGHYFKSPSTTRFSTMMKLRDKTKNRCTLTGTPITNTPLDLYAQFEFMGKGFSGFTSWKTFKDFYGVYEDQGGHNRLVGVGNMPFLQERLAKLSFVIKKEEALPDLPDKVYDVIEVEMGAKQKDIYNNLASQLAIEIENDLDSSQNKSLVLNNILVKLLRLAQITSGFISWDPVFTDDGEEVHARRIEAFSPNPKLDALLECLAEKGPNDKTIVWACWRQDVNKIMEVLTSKGIRAVKFDGSSTEAERVKAEHAFNYDNSCKVFVGNAVAGGTGLNLLGYPPGGGEGYVTNCTHVIYYSQNWSMTARAQSEDRAHRRGTRTNVRISDLCVPETIDEQIRSRVMGKISTALKVSDVREILKEVLKGA